MAYNKVNGKVCVARLLNNYNVSQYGWIPRSPEWINEAIGLMRMVSPLITAEPKEIEIEEYKGKLPCNIRLLLAVEYNGQRLPCISDSVNTLYKDDLELQTSLVEHYELDDNGNIITSFESGTIRVHFKELPIEFDSELNIYFPLIPNNEKVIAAIIQYLLVRILTKGYKIPELSLKENNPYINPGLAWDDLRKKAENSQVIKDVNELEEISVITKTFLYDNNVYYNKHFNNSK
jgi:hypothetical protein